MESYGISDEVSMRKQKRGGKFQSEIDSYGLPNHDDNVILLQDESYLNSHLMIDIDYDK